MICYFCNQNPANTLEHVIPKGLGGKKQARIWCHICNNKFGREVDEGLISFFSSKGDIADNVVLRGVLKIAINFCISSGIAVKREIIEMLVLEEKLDKFIKEVKYIPRQNEISHSLVAKKELYGRFYAVITLYNRSFFVDFEDKCEDEGFEKTYCYSFTRCKKMEIENTIYTNV